MSTVLTARTVPAGRSGGGRSGRGPRPRRSGRRRLLVWLAGLLALAVLLTGGWLVAFSTALVAKRVEVTGEDLLTRRQILQAAAVPIGVPLVRQDVDAVAGRVARLPEVRSVRVHREWPDAVAVEVTERTPVLVAASNGRYLLVDASGVVFHTLDDRPRDLVQATVDPTDARLLVAASTAVAALPDAFADRVATVGGRSPDGLILRLKSGTELRWGNPTDSALKADVATALLRGKPRMIDVSAPNTPAVR